MRRPCKAQRIINGMPDKADNLCAQCNNPALQRCSGCYEVYYCNREHQRSHWKIHGKNCKPYKMTVNELLGRHYVATKDIKVGELVIYEKAPLLRAFKAVVSVCAGCYIVLSKDTAKPCVKCGWPLCYDCTQHGAECEFTEKHRNSMFNITACTAVERAYYMTIPIVCALALRETNPDAYKRLLKLESNIGKPRNDLINEPQPMALFVKYYCHLEDIEEEEITKIAGILQTNAFRMKKQKYSSEIAVFDKSSYIEHSCRANCSRTPTADGGIMIWAARPIFKGDHISINYIDSTLSTLQRRKHLYKSKFFHCTCERCIDPTEFETMFSAFRCFKEECAGFMLPPTFGELETYSDFACNKCKATMPWAKVDNMEHEMHTMMASTEGGNSKSLDVCNKFAEKHAKMLHENHFFKFFVDVQTFVSKKGRDITSLSNRQLGNRIVRSKKLIELFEILVPSDHRRRGILLYLLYLAQSELEQRKDLVVNNILELPQHVLECRKMLKEAHLLLYREQPVCDSANKIAKQCLAQIEQLEALESLQSFSRLKM